MPVPPPQNPPEFSRILPLERIGTAWQTKAITASEAECAALAGRFGLVALRSLRAELRVRRARAGRYVAIEAGLLASVVQTCVVTLEPVPAELDERFSLLLGPIGRRAVESDIPAAGDLIVDLDEPEPLDGDEIDLGELVAQQLSLALDPYPRAPDVDAAAVATIYGDAAPTEEGDAPPSSPNPFAALATRRKPQ
jgi:uncharacterized metal-binding protein YceD (DUF177 family)